MTLLSLPKFRDRRPAHPLPRRRPIALRPTLDHLEERLVLSTAAHPVATAEVHALATAAKARLSVPIVISGIDITNVTRNANGLLQFSGTIGGTIFGQTFTTPLTGSVAAGKSAPTLKLNLQPIQLGLQGLNVTTGALNLSLTTAGKAGTLGKLLATDLNAAIKSGSAGTSQVASLLNTDLNNAGLLNALNRTFAQSTAKLASATPATAGAPTMVNFNLAGSALRFQGLSGKLLAASNSPVSVKLSAAPNSGLLGNLLGGISGGTSPASLGQVSSALNTIDTTVVPITSTTLPGLLGSSPSTTTAPASSVSTAGATPILNLTLAPIDLNLLGLEVKLYGNTPADPVTVAISALPGSGDLLGNLLADVSGLLNTQGVSKALNTVLGSVINLANASTLSVNGSTPSTTYTSTTSVLDAFIAPVHLNLLGALVDTSPIHLQILAHAGNGLLLGNIVTGLANLLNNPSGNLVKDLESGLNNLLGQLNTLYPGLNSTPSTPPLTSNAPGSTQILSLTVPPINLDLLGLILQTSTIQVNATAQSGSGELLGNLLSDVLNTANITPTDLLTINGQLNSVLGKVVGVLNASTLTLSSGALGTLTPLLQELASPTLINTTGGSVPPESVLNLNIASNNGGPPVDVNLLGLVVTTSDIQVQLLAQPGNGKLLGNLVYNVSHLLDGGLLNVLSILNGLGI